jgi:deoxyribonuclease-1
MCALFAVVLLAPISTLALGELPPRPFNSFNAAKRVARDAIYSEHHTDFYCGCAFTPTKTKSGGTIDATSCGYTSRKNKARGRVLEWEHVVPSATVMPGRSMF